MTEYGDAAALAPRFAEIAGHANVITDPRELRTYEGDGPTPPSQVVCSVGGNVAENSGGAHCLKYGFTVHHVLALQVALPSGPLAWIGDGTGAAPGYDLLGAFVGSEGTLGIVTKIVVRLTRLPAAVRTLPAAFTSTDAGGAAVWPPLRAGGPPAAGGTRAS